MYHNRRKKKYHNGRHSFLTVKLIFILLLIFLPIGIFILQLNEKITASITELSHMQSKITANHLIDHAVEETIKKLNINSSDFFISQADSPATISANTILINEFCTAVSSTLTDDLNQLADEEIGVPLGMVSGIELFSNHGPDIRYSLRPAGAASVDYDTSFTSVGINQINFKIWINVAIDIRIVFPLHQETIALSRKIMVVDAVLSGTVPDHYLDFSQ